MSFDIKNKFFKFIKKNLKKKIILLLSVHMIGGQQRTYQVNLEIETFKKKLKILQNISHDLFSNFNESLLIDNLEDCISDSNLLILFLTNRYRNIK